MVFDLLQEQLSLDIVRHAFGFVLSFIKSCRLRENPSLIEGGSGTNSYIVCFILHRCVTRAAIIELSGLHEPLHEQP